MALSAIALCSRALLKVGASAITGFDDGTAEAEVAAALYGPIRDLLLSAHDWNFATTQARLARLADDPVTDYACAHQLPSDLLRVLSAGRDGRGRGLTYRLAGETLQSDSETVYLNYICRPAEADCPAFFDGVLIARLAAEFCLPLTENSSRAEMLFKLADTEFRRVRLMDASQDTRAGFEDFTLIDVRHP